MRPFLTLILAMAVIGGCAPPLPPPPPPLTLSMELVDFLIRNQLIALSLILFTILATLFYKRYRDRIGMTAIGEWLPQAGLAVLLPALVGGGLSLASLEPISKTTALDPPEPLCHKSANRKLLVFIHGWRGDSKNTWRNFPWFACKDPRISDVNIWVVDYPTYMLRRNLHIAAVSDWLYNKLDVADQSQRYEKMAIVAHSLGGLIAREMVIISRLAQKQVTSQEQVTFGLLISVASPYEGADIAGLGDALNISQCLAEEATPGSSFLVTLGKHWDLLTPRPKTYCYSGVGDAVVSTSSAEAKCDRSTTHPHHHWGHQDLVKPDHIWDDRYALPMHEIGRFMSSTR